MRLPLASDLISRDGTTDKDALIKNGIVEIDGEESVVRQRPGISEAMATSLGFFAQGGMQFGDSLVIINGDDAFYFDDSWVLQGGYNLITGSPFIVYASDMAYDLGDLVYYQDPDTGEITPWYPFSPLAGIPPSTDPTNPGYWLWSLTPPVNNWYWLVTSGPETGTQVSGFGSCGAATQGFLSAHPSPDYVYTTTGCRNFNYSYLGNPPISTSLGPYVVTGYSPL